MAISAPEMRFLFNHGMFLTVQSSSTFNFYSPVVVWCKFLDFCAISAKEYIEPNVNTLNYCEFCRN